MNEIPTDGAAPQSLYVSLPRIFFVFLFIGATSFGGGVVAYLRSSLVRQQKWLDDEKFLELLSISQSLPGLNATNMAVLVGDRLRGASGAACALLGICLPGALMMFAVGAAFTAHGDKPLISAMLRGVAAAAVGLVLSTTLQLGRNCLRHPYDLLLVALAVVGINVFHQSVPVVLLSLGALAVFWYRPRGTSKDVSER